MFDSGEQDIADLPGEEHFTVLPPTEYPTDAALGGPAHDNPFLSLRVGRSSIDFYWSRRESNPGAVQFLGHSAVVSRASFSP